MALSPCVLWALYRTITGEQRWRNARSSRCWRHCVYRADMRAFVVVMFARLGSASLALTRIPQRDRSRRSSSCLRRNPIDRFDGGGAAATFEIAPELSRNGLTQTDSYLSARIPPTGSSSFLSIAR
ncbi:MAG: hypothetical protein U0528_07745 [Anaerolineae bacterium]